MVTIRCPECGSVGDSAWDSDAFVSHGIWRFRPVRSCRRCGCGMTLGLIRARAQRIEHEAWGRVRRLPWWPR